MTPDGTMGLNKTTPWGCPDCHVSGRSQYAKYFKNGGNTTDVVIYEHNPYTGDIRTTKDCQICHNKSVINNTNDPTIPNAEANVSHYGTKDGLKVGPTDTNTSDCVGCHKLNDVWSDEWFAPNLDSIGLSRMGTTDEVGCWKCHLLPLQVGNAPSRSFHEDDLLKGSWRCTDCHTN